MRLYISDNKDDVIFFMYEYLKGRLDGLETRFIVNGREYTGTINDSELDLDNQEWMKFKLDDVWLELPVNDNSKIRLDKGIFYFETDSHTTLIYT